MVELWMRSLCNVDSKLGHLQWLCVTNGWLAEQQSSLEAQEN